MASGNYPPAPHDKAPSATTLLWRYSWVYLVAAFLGGIVVVAIWGRTWISLLVILLLIVCPAVIIWGALALARPAGQGRK